MTFKTYPLAILAFGLHIIVPASCAHADWYVGGGIGQASIDGTAGEIEDAFLIDDDFVATDTTLDKSDNGWKVFGGYRFPFFLAIEAAYADLGKATFSTTIAEAPPPDDANTPFPIQGTATADGVQLSALLHIPVPGPINGFVRAGAFRWEAEFTEVITDTGATRVARTEEEIDAVFGAGLQFDFFDTVSARAEWERLQNVGEGIGGRTGRDVDFFSAGILVRF